MQTDKCRQKGINILFYFFHTVINACSLFHFTCTFAHNGIILLLFNNDNGKAGPSSVLVLAEIELIIFTVAFMGLCFALVLETVGNIEMF